MIAPIEATLGERVTLEGYADDYGCQIVGLQFSLDGGKSWATFDTADSSPDLWVHWRYSFVPEEAGAYRVKARSLNAKGEESPMAAVAIVFVEQP